MAADSRLFLPLQVGPYQLSSRIAMAPLTRSRALDNNAPVASMAEYYEQRSCEPGTLLITEATLISPNGGTKPHVPGIWTSDQIAGWKAIVDRVHRAKGVIFLQLWALGRTDDAAARKAAGLGDLLSSSNRPHAEGASIPRAMTEAEIQQIIAEYATAAKNAVDGAGFDGVEIHGANGFLVDQFLQDVCNDRTDRWGGSVENRSRFAIEVAIAVAVAVGAEKTGIRLSPWSAFLGMRMEDPVPQFSHLISRLKGLKLAFIHLIGARVSGNIDVEATETCDPFMSIWGKDSPILLAGGYIPESAKKAVDEEYPEYNLAIVFGRPFIANPDLVFRARNGIALNAYDRGTFYSDGDEGYLDYPFSDEWKRQHAKPVS